MSSVPLPEVEVEVAVPLAVVVAEEVGFGKEISGGNPARAASSAAIAAAISASREVSTGILVTAGVDDGSSMRDIVSVAASSSSSSSQ